jgi:hypothetical protein
MSKDRLSERLREVSIPAAVDAREGAVAEARAEVTARSETAPARGDGRRRTLALAAAALLALVVLLTPPGRAASAWVGELVGIGEVGGEPTQRYRTFGIDGSAVVINNGRAPDGTRYEWVAYECKVDMREEGSPDPPFHGIGMSFEWPDVKGYEGSGGCEELQGRPRPEDAAVGGSVHIVPSQNKGVEQPDLVVSGQTGPGVHDVKVIYREPDGTERELPVDFARVEGELREAAHRPEALGTFVAFLQGDVAARDEIEARLDLRALLDTGKLRLGPISRRERELAQAARERCEHLEPELADLPADPNNNRAFKERFQPVVDCHEREMPPSPFVYVAYDAEGKEIGRMNEPLITAMVVRPSEIDPAGRERPGEEPQEWRKIPGSSDPVQVMSGRAPDGALYRVMVTKQRDIRMSCMTVWWPYVKEELSGGTCGSFPPETAFGRREPEKVAARPYGFLTPMPHATRYNLLSGFARPFVSRVRVIYRDKDGERHDAPVELTQVRGELAERIKADAPAGFWVAFLPRSTGKRPIVEVIAYDENGRVASRIDYRA